MSTPLIFNRRVGVNELDMLLDLFESIEIDRMQSAKFLRLENSIAFISSVQDEIIGGIIVYRDRLRLGMALAATAIKKEYRQLSSYTIIKSSLPFFRTVAIRDVDAIVSDIPDIDALRFPYSFHLPKWTKQFLEKNGFSEECKIYSCKLEFEPENLRKDTEFNIDPVANLEGAKSLIWDTGKTTGLTNSIIWMSLDFASQLQILRTVSENDSTQLAYSLITNGNKTNVGFIVSSDEFLLTKRTSAILASDIVKTQMRDVRFPLVGAGQVELLKTIAEEVGGSLKSSSITLMRRRL